jgi:hypothetical protein
MKVVESLHHPPPFRVVPTTPKADYEYRDCGDTFIGEKATAHWTFANTSE